MLMFAASFLLCPQSKPRLVQGASTISHSCRCMQVWTLSDSARRGFLDEKAFCKVCPLRVWRLALQLTSALRAACILTLHGGLQAMEFISIAQQTGEVSIEAYTRMALPGTLQPPEMEGLDDMIARMNSANNPFSTSDPEAYAPMTNSLTSQSSAPSYVGLSSIVHPSAGCERLQAYELRDCELMLPCSLPMLVRCMHHALLRFVAGRQVRAPIVEMQTTSGKYWRNVYQPCVIMDGWHPFADL